MNTLDTSLMAHLTVESLSVTDTHLHSPSCTSAPVKTEHGWFRFHTLPWRIHEPDNLPVEDWRDNRVDYPRATPEKAFADWLYLARSPRSWLKRPPYDLEFAELNKKRLGRIIKALSLEDVYQEWVEKKNQYDQDPDVIANDYTGEVPRVKKPS